MVVYRNDASIVSHAWQMQLTVVFLKEVIKARRMRQKGQMESTGTGQLHTWFGMGTPEGKISFGRSRPRWKYIIK
jgi:hypothetical protein